MQSTDILIAGGGLAGSMAAAILARAGYGVVVVDPHRTYPPDFRCEKIDGPQMVLLRKTGLADAVIHAAALDGEAWVAQLGHLVDRRSGDQFGILYGDLVNAMRGQIPASATIVHGKVVSISTSSDRQTVTLSNGHQISARLVVLANGLNASLRQSLGMVRDVLSEAHSVTIGFDMKPVGGAAFPFSSLSYYAERPADNLAYLTLFPAGTGLRANFMVYRDIHDPWLEKFRTSPVACLHDVMPGLRRLTGDFEVSGHIKIRPADLYVTRGVARAGIVLAGDAYSTSCPAAGTGTSKVFTDVERLCNIYIPRWLASDGMGMDKIAEFYADPVKQACDSHSLAKAYSLKSLTTDDSLKWHVRRGLRFAYRYGAWKTRQGRAWLGWSIGSGPLAPKAREPSVTDLETAGSS